MTKIALMLMLTLVGLNAFAAADYVGSWCHRYDDFTEVVVIDEKDTLKSYSIGNTSGEIHRRESGFVSLGANNFQIQLNGADLGVVDYKVKKALFSKKRILTLIMQDGEKQSFNECVVKSR